jgi:eukaryotic-like serine/threonine-protein kinase
MALTAGTRLGSYEVLSQIGAGGMGEVYQAHDTKLGRDVAIKVLPEAFAHDPERLSRFQREAKMLAALNHPNIATIHGLEQSGGTSYLVMELVSGETLQERVKREGPVPVEEALAIAKQIAEALEAAHEKGIIHRDLKPANVKLTPDGKVKVLDFGLAKAFAGDATNEDLSNSPTLSRAATMQGVILGTAAYMSPEQAKGKAVDKRTDIWAFGCVVYELLTGKAAFHGEDVTDILAAVVRAEPDWSRLPPSTPTKIRDLLRRCLQKDKTLRLQAAGDARIEIHEALTTPTPAEPVAAQRKSPLSNIRTAWSVAAIAIVTAALGWGAFAYFRHAQEGAQPVRFFFSPPDGWALEQPVGTGGASTIPLAASPNGHRVAFVASGMDG